MRVRVRLRAYWVLSRLACRLRRQLGDQNRAVEVLILHAAANCSPPFPEDEALRKVEQAFKQDHSDSGDTTHVDGFRKSHGGNSIRFARKFGHKIIYVAGPGWYAWNGSVWRRCESVDVERIAKDVVEDLYDLARHPELTGPDRTKTFTFASRTDGPHGIESMIKMARSDEGLLRWPDELDADPYKFAVKNGIVDLRTGKLIASSRFDLITSRSRYDFNPATPTPRWSAFLNWAMVGDQAMISFLQQLAGLSMIGAAPEHIMPVMLGSGRNGKNTFVETLTSILGDYAMFPFPTGALTSANMDPQATARLFGKRLAVASEANKRVPLNSAVINSYTGDGQLLAKFLYKDTFTFQTTHLLMLVANNRPKVTDTNDGIWSRLKLINWSAKIGDHEKIPRYHELMLQEEGPGIVAWCVAGAMDYLTNGLRVPPKVTEASDAYRRVEDVNGSFIEDCVVAGPSEFHYTFHRRLGRVLAGAAMISGVFALIFGGRFSYGGLPEASAAVVFGLWFLTCLVLAVRAIRRDDIVHHRRWMIRAFAIGIGIGTTRIWLALFGIAGLDFASSFGPAFWISFSLHAVAAELWLRAFPNPPELANEPPGATSSPRPAAAAEAAG